MLALLPCAVKGPLQWSLCIVSLFSLPGKDSVSIDSDCNAAGLFDIRAN